MARLIRLPLLAVMLWLPACVGVLDNGEDLAPLGGDTVEMPPGVEATSGRGFQPFMVGEAPTVLYLHFGGLTIKHHAGASDAATNTSFIGKGGTIPALAATVSFKAGVVAKVKQLFAAYSLRVVTSRPATGDYAMVVVGGWPHHLGYGKEHVWGVAPMDCGDRVPRDIGFAFGNKILADSSGPLAEQTYWMANTIAHEAAHTFGLPHSDDAADILSYRTHMAKTFLNKTMPMQADAKGTCGLHAMNSRQLLLKALGALDTKAPIVGITSPANGATVEPHLKVTASVKDDRGITKAVLLVDGKAAVTRTTTPFEFSVELTVGKRALTVTAVDTSGHQSTASITVNVLERFGVKGTLTLLPPPPAPDGATCGANEDCASGLCSAGLCGAPAPQPPPADEPADAGTVEWEGGCSAGGGAGPGDLWWLLLVGLAHGRRPRRRRGSAPVE